MTDKIKELHKLSMLIQDKGRTPLALRPKGFEGDEDDYRIQEYKKILKINIDKK